jgi:predicted nucleic acid-binding protein
MGLALAYEQGVGVKLDLPMGAIDEILAAIRRLPRQERLRLIEQAANEAAEGRIIGIPDVFIAAIALQNGLPIVTGNVAHFGQAHIDNGRTT